MDANRIMIVDDNKDFLGELKETLYLCGYDAKTVSDSSHAAAVAKKLKPELILLDLRMDKMNGFQVAEQLKRAKDTSCIPIVAMSGHFPIDNDRLLLDMSKMEARISKPFSISDLITQIENLIGKV